MDELSRFRFFAKAVWADVKESRTWKVVTFSYPFLGGLALVQWFLTVWTPGQLIGSWSLRTRAILVLVFICLTLIMLLIAVIDGARRVYNTAVSNLEKTFGETTSSLQRKIVGQVNIHGDEIKTLEENHKRHLEFITGHHHRDFQKILNDKKRLEAEFEQLSNAHNRLKETR